MRSQEPTKDGSNPLRVPALCPDFLIETYLDHQVRSPSSFPLLPLICPDPPYLSQGEQWCLKYDANSFIYVSKAMDLFDMSSSALVDIAHRRSQLETPTPTSGALDSLLPPSSPPVPPKGHLLTSHAPYLDDLAQGLSNLKDIPTLVLGVQSDILFPVEQQRDLAEALRRAGNEKVGYYELGGVWG